MATRSSWKGYLQLSLVCVPVKAYTTSISGGGEIHLHQLHTDCHNRIQYKKVCPLHGEVTNDQIVSGYEYARDRYVVVNPDELDRLRTEADKAIKIDVFIPSDAFDPLYTTGKKYYLAPNGPAGQKAYALLAQAMVAEDRYGVAQVVLHGREQLVLVRPQENLLILEVLHYRHQITQPADLADEVSKTEVSPEELQMARTLVNTSTADFNLEKYSDLYTRKLEQLIEAKVAGQELVTPPATEGPQVINLMEALRQSVARVQGIDGTKKESRKSTRRLAHKTPVNFPRQQKLLSELPSSNLDQATERDTLRKVQKVNARRSSCGLAANGRPKNRRQDHN